MAARVTRIDCGHLIAFIDGRHVVVRGGTVLIEGDRIVHAGGATTAPWDERIDATDKIVAPGFVSTHNHLGASPFDRSFRDDTSSRYFWQTGLYEFLTPIRGAMTAEAVRAAYRASCVEVLHSGVTTAVELTGWSGIAEEVMTEFGLRSYIGPYLRSASWRIEGRRLVYDWLDADAESAIYEAARAFVADHSDPDGLVRGVFAPAQVDTCSPALIQRAAADARALGAPIHIHASQSVTEFREMLERTASTPIEFLHDLGVMDENLTVAHAIFTAGNSHVEYPWGQDIAYLATGGSTVAHCPQAFARYGIALESASSLIRAGVRVALGTDTTPQSMLLEMRLAAQLAKHVDRDAFAFGAADAFHAATVAGADSLGRPDLGRIEAGAKADMVFYRTDTSSMSPLRDPVLSIVYSALPSDVDRVIVGGETRLAAGRVVGVDEQEIARGMQTAAEAVWDAIPEHSGGRTAEDLAPFSVPQLSAESLGAHADVEGEE
jgi:cytosine/adenosine deaminase-related metal-dependent hydrolase